MIDFHGQPVMYDIMECAKDVSGDPYCILKLLNDRLGRDGNITDIDDIVCVLELMEEAKMLVHRCIFINILRATKNRDVLLRLIQDGGWDTLYKWLQEARLESNTPLLLELLKLYKHLPITVTLLKQNNCAKDIRQLVKSGDEKVERLCKEIVDDWMLKVKENSSAEKRSSDKPKNNDSSSSSSSRSAHSSSSSSSKKESQATTSGDSLSSSANRVAHIPSENVKRTLTNGGDSGSFALSDTNNIASASSSDNFVSDDVVVNKDKQHRAKTVKMVGSKMRSTGNDEDMARTV